MIHNTVQVFVCSYSSMVLIIIMCLNTLFISCCVKYIIVMLSSLFLILPQPSLVLASGDGLLDHSAILARNYTSHPGC